MKLNAACRQSRHVRVISGIHRSEGPSKRRNIIILFPAACLVSVGVEARSRDIVFVAHHFAAHVVGATIDRRSVTITISVSITIFLSKLFNQYQ